MRLDLETYQKLWTKHMLASSVVYEELQDRIPKDYLYIVQAILSDYGRLQYLSGYYGRACEESTKPLNQGG
jgi:hypothetical protein